MDEARYRVAERNLWAECGWPEGPAEHRVRLSRLGMDVRVMEVGSGAPTLFLHGGPNAGSTWAPMVQHLRDRRCLILDRPGTGLSDPYPLHRGNVAEFADTLVAEVLDGLGLERVDVVASSFGGYAALRSAAAHPERVGAIVQMACPAFVPGFVVPAFMRLLMVPGMRHVFNALPPNERAGRMTLRQIGHGVSLDRGLIPQTFFDWFLALQRFTDTFPNETGMIARLGGIGGFDPSLTLGADVLGSVRAPTRFLWGADDPFGDEAVARGVVALMPEAELEMLPDAGHLPWIDAPEYAADVTRRFLAAAAPYGASR